MMFRITVIQFVFLTLAGLSACGHDGTPQPAASDAHSAESTPRIYPTSTPSPTPAPTSKPTLGLTPSPTPAPTPKPTLAPTPTPTPTATPTLTAVLTPTPSQPSTATSVPTETEEPNLELAKPETTGYICDPNRYVHMLVQGTTYSPADYGARGDWVDENYIRWSPDGSRILFDVSEKHYEGPVDLYSVATDGSWLYTIVDESDRGAIWGPGSSMTYFDVSPDSARIAYSTCAFNKDVDTEKGDGSWVHNYDIVVANADGTVERRLTRTVHFENFPVWSPDGTAVVYFSLFEDFVPPVRHGRVYLVLGRLTIHLMTTDTTRDIVLPIGDVVAPHPPVWSPDGRSLAFVVYEKVDPLTAAVYAVGIDGSTQIRISDAASGPAWSPDGKRIAVAVPRGPNNADLYSFAADGSDPILVSDNLPESWDYPVQPWMGNLSWSPDGSAILLEGFAFAVNVDGSGILFDGFESLLVHLEGLNPPAFPTGSPEATTFLIKQYLANIHMFATWSPDGSKIAVRTEVPEERGLPRTQVHIMDLAGSDTRLLVEGVKTNAGIEVKLAE